MEKCLLNSLSINKTIKDLALEVKTNMAGKFVIIGIKRRGSVIAERLKNILEKSGVKDIPLGFLDITLYRDDFSKISHNPIVSGTEIMFNIENNKILLVDDVLYTGRTIRAALDELMDFGRPQEVKLLVLVDRGDRQLPIQPDFVGIKTVVNKNQMVEVRLKEVDKKEEIVIVTKQ